MSVENLQRGFVAEIQGGEEREEETYEAEDVVEQEWNQHRCGHLVVRGETTDSLVIFIIGTVAHWILLTLVIIITNTPIIITMITVLSSPVQFDDQIDVSDSIQGW